VVSVWDRREPADNRRLAKIVWSDNKAKRTALFFWLFFSIQAAVWQILRAVRTFQQPDAKKRLWVFSTKNFGKLCNLLLTNSVNDGENTHPNYWESGTTKVERMFSSRTASWTRAGHGGPNRWPEEHGGGVKKTWGFATKKIMKS